MIQPLSLINIQINQLCSVSVKHFIDQDLGQDMYFNFKMLLPERQIKSYTVYQNYNFILSMWNYFYVNK